MNKKKTLYAVGIGVPLIAFIGFLIWEAKTLNYLVMWFQSNPAAFLLVIAAAVFGFGTFVTIMMRGEESFSRFSRDEPKSKKTPVSVPILLGVVTALAVLGWCFVVFTGGYFALKEINASVSETREPATPTYNQRAALPVAAAQARQAVTDQGADLHEINYIPNTDNYTSLVSGRGVFDGFREVISQKVALTGRATSTTCSFNPQASDRFGAYFNHNMWRNATKAAGLGSLFQERDSYAYCDGKTPIVVMPFLRYQGFFPATIRPAGVVTYNGETGEYKVLDSVAQGALNGPVYPASVSELVRESTMAAGSFSDYFFSRLGYEDTNKGEDDPNGANSAEFGLMRADKKTSDWVTPLTLRGDSTSIAGVSFTSSGSLTPGQYNPMTIRIFETQRPANNAVFDQVKSDYNRDNLNWADKQLQLWEITPVNDKEWVASIGYPRNIIARVRMKADLSSCLEDGNGKVIRCTTSGGSNQHPAPSSTPSPTAPTTNVPSDKKLGDMTTEELSALQKQVTDEMIRRIKAQK